MMGPWTYAQHLLSGPRLPFTAAYFGSITLTLYFSLGVRIPPRCTNLTKSKCGFLFIIVMIICLLTPTHSLEIRS